MSKRDKRRTGKQGNRETGKQGGREAGEQGSGAIGRQEQRYTATHGNPGQGAAFSELALTGGETLAVSTPLANEGRAPRLPFTLTSAWVVPILSILGILDSLYLSYVKIAHAQPFCAGIGDCETVNSSIYSVFAGIPIAYLGVGMYLTLLLLSGWGWRLPAPLAGYAPLAIFGISLGGVLYSAYLTYLEIYVIEAICIYCVISAILISLIFVWSLWRLMRGEPVAEGLGVR